MAAPPGLRSVCLGGRLVHRVGLGLGLVLLSHSHSTRDRVHQGRLRDAGQDDITAVYPVYEDTVYKVHKLHNLMK